MEIESQNLVLEPIIPMGLSDFMTKAQEALDELSDSNTPFAFSLFAWSDASYRRQSWPEKSNMQWVATKP